MINSLNKGLTVLVILLTLVCVIPGIALAGEIVVLLHGIANVPLSMKVIENSLEEAGFRVHNLGYPSTEETIEEASRQVLNRVSSLAGGSTVHFVGHSMGNLVVRAMLREEAFRPGRIVMIAPPNQGAYAAQRLKDLDIYRWFFGPAGTELAADNRVFFDSLPVPRGEFGIIAGGTGTEDGYNPFLEGDDDGTVRVEETRLPGAADFILVHSTHTLILFDPETARQTISFLKSGRFQKAE